MKKQSQNKLAKQAISLSVPDAIPGIIYIMSYRMYGSDTIHKTSYTTDYHDMTVRHIQKKHGLKGSEKIVVVELKSSGETVR